MNENTKIATVEERVIYDKESRVIARYNITNSIKLIFYPSKYDLDTVYYHIMKIGKEKKKDVKKMVSRAKNENSINSISLEKVNELIEDLKANGTDSSVYKEYFDQYLTKTQKGLLNVTKVSKMTQVTLFEEDTEDFRYRKTVLFYDEILNKELIELYKSGNGCYLPEYTMLITTVTNKGEVINDLYKIVDPQYNSIRKFTKNIEKLNEACCAFHEQIYKFENTNIYIVEYDYRFMYGPNNLAISYPILPKNKNKRIFEYRNLYSYSGTLMKEPYKCIGSVKYENNNYIFDIKDISMMATLPMFSNVFCNTDKFIKRYMSYLTDPETMMEKFNKTYVACLKSKKYEDAKLLLVDTKPDSDQIATLFDAKLHKEYLLNKGSRFSISVIENPYVDQVPVNPNIFVYDIDLSDKGTIPCTPRIVYTATQDITNHINMRIHSYDPAKEVFVMNFEYEDYTDQQYIADEIDKVSDSVDKNPFYADKDHKYKLFDCYNYLFDSEFDIKKYHVSVNMDISKNSQKNIVISSKDLVIRIHNASMRLESPEQFNGHPNWSMGVDILNKKIQYGFVQDNKVTLYTIKDVSMYSENYIKSRRDNRIIRVHRIDKFYNENGELMEDRVQTSNFILPVAVKERKNKKKWFKIPYISVTKDSNYEFFRTLIAYIRNTIYTLYPKAEDMIGGVGGMRRINNAIKSLIEELYKGGYYSPYKIFNILDYGNYRFSNAYMTEKQMQYDEDYDLSIKLANYGNYKHRYEMFQLFDGECYKSKGTVTLCMDILNQLINETKQFNEIFYYI